MAAAARADAAAERARKKTRDVFAALPRISLPHTLLLGASFSAAAEQEQGQEQGEEEAMMKVREGLWLQHQSVACVVFFFSRGALQPSPERRIAEDRPEGFPLPGLVRVRLAILRCRGTSDACIAIGLVGGGGGEDEAAGREGAGSEGGVEKAEEGEGEGADMAGHGGATTASEAEVLSMHTLSAAQLDTLISRAMAPGSPQLCPSGADRDELMLLAAGKVTLHTQLASLGALDHEAQGGEGQGQWQGQGGSLGRLRARLVRAAMEAHLPPLHEGRPEVLCHAAAMAPLVMAEGGGSDVPGAMLSWTAGRAEVRAWLGAAGLSLGSQPLLLTISLRSWLQQAQQVAVTDAMDEL